jgi:GAF domain-containing protein
LAEEQAALRRVATLVARGARPAEVFTSVADELGRLIGAQASFVSRLDHPAGEDREPEGYVTVVTSRDDFPPGTESRIADFTELAAMAIANTQAEQELHELADTQAALRRLATLVARGEPAEAVFAAATREALQYFGGGIARMIRYEPDGTATLVAREGTTYPERVGRTLRGVSGDRADRDRTADRPTCPGR